MPSYAASAPVAQHRGGDAQLAGDLHQWPTAACQQGDRLRLELIRKTTPFLAHSTPSRSLRSLAKVSTNSGEAHRLHPAVAWSRSRGARPLHPQPPGRDAGGAAPKGGERAGAPAGGRHGAEALWRRRVAGGEAWHQAAPGLESTAS